MITIRDNRKPTAVVYFVDLPIGATYEDKDRVFCIKTSEHRCIAYIECNDEWEEHEEDDDAIITPLKVSITIEG